MGKIDICRKSRMLKQNCANHIDVNIDEIVNFPKGRRGQYFFIHSVLAASLRIKQSF